MARSGAKKRRHSPSPPALHTTAAPCSAASRCVIGTIRPAEVGSMAGPAPRRPAAAAALVTAAVAERRAPVRARARPVVRAAAIA